MWGVGVYISICTHTHTHTDNGTLLSHQKHEILPFAAMWMDPETVILSEISQRRRNII